jgi:hypothetical protein
MLKWLLDIFYGCERGQKDFADPAASPVSIVAANLMRASWDRFVNL